MKKAINNKMFKKFLTLLSSKIKDFFHAPKHAKPTDENIVKLILPSILGIALCVVALVGGTFAWFNSASSTPVQAISSASYDITATVDGGNISFNKEDVSYKAVFTDGEYTVHLRESDSSNATTGYCKIEYNGKVEYTAQFPSADNTDGILNFFIKVDGLDSVEVKITPQWGTSSAFSVDSAHLITEGKTITIAYTTPEPQINTLKTPDSEEKSEPKTDTPDTSNPTEMFVTADNVRVRKGADIKSEIITELYTNTKVTAYEKIGDWYYIQYKSGKYGFMHADYLSTEQVTEETQTTTTKMPSTTEDLTQETEDTNNNESITDASESP